jgi:hypothetical protein
MNLNPLHWIRRHVDARSREAEEHQRQVRDEQERLEEEIRMVRLRKEREVWRGR